MLQQVISIKWSFHLAVSWNHSSGNLKNNSESHYPQTQPKRLRTLTVANHISLVPFWSTKHADGLRRHTTAKRVPLAGRFTLEVCQRSKTKHLCAMAKKGQKQVNIATIFGIHLTLILSCSSFMKFKVWQPQPIHLRLHSTPESLCLWQTSWIGKLMPFAMKCNTYLPRNPEVARLEMRRFVGDLKRCASTNIYCPSCVCGYNCHNLPRIMRQSQSPATYILALAWVRFQAERSLIHKL